MTGMMEHLKTVIGTDLEKVKQAAPIPGYMLWFPIGTNLKQNVNTGCSDLQNWQQSASWYRITM